MWLDGRLAGYVDISPDVTDGLDPDEVNISYATHPWARGRGLAVDAVRLGCEVITRDGLGRRAALRIDVDNAASHRVATKAGFTAVRDFVSATDTGPDGAPVTMRLWLRDLNERA